MAGHRPVERRDGESLGFSLRHAHRHPIRGLAGLISVGQRQHAVVHRQRVGKRLRVGLGLVGRLQVVLRHEQELRFRRLLVPHVIDQFGDTRHLLQPGRVEPVRGFIEVDVAGAAQAGEHRLRLGAHPAVVFQEIKRPGHGVADQALADENLRRVDRVDLQVTHRTRLELKVVKPAALLHQHASAGFVPERLAVRHAQDVFAEIEHPLRIDARAGAGIKPRRLHDLGRHQPARHLFGRTRTLGWLGGELFFAGFPLLKQRRARKHIHAPVVRGMVIGLIRPRRDIAQQPGENAAVDRRVGRRAHRQVGLFRRRGFTPHLFWVAG